MAQLFSEIQPFFPSKKEFFVRIGYYTNIYLQSKLENFFKT